MGTKFVERLANPTHSRGRRSPRPLTSCACPPPHIPTRCLDRPQICIEGPVVLFRVELFHQGQQTQLILRDHVIFIRSNGTGGIEGLHKSSRRKATLAWNSPYIKG